MDYLDIIEENFTKSDYVAYLRGSILRFLLADEPFDTTEFKQYADKLVETMEEQPTVDSGEPMIQPKPKFKLGDRVIVTYNNYTGTIVRLPMTGVDFPNGYIIQLDNKADGFHATCEEDGVDCNSGWFASECNLELINDVKLETGKWYHTTDFTMQELQALLPTGTVVVVEKEVLYNNIDTTPPIKTKQAIVKEIVASAIEEQVFISIFGDNFYKEWFKII